MRIVYALIETLSYLGLLLCIVFVYCAYANPQEIAHVVCSLRADNAADYAACRSMY